MRTALVAMAIASLGAGILVSISGGDMQKAIFHVLVAIFDVLVAMYMKIEERKND